MNIQGLINKGIAQLRQEKAEAVATREAEERERKEERELGKMCIVQELKAIIPEEIEPFAMYEIAPPPAWQHWISFNVPNCCPLSALYSRGNDGYALNRYQANYATRVETAYQRPPKLCKESRSFDDLTRALGFAAIRFKKEEELQETLARTQAEYEDEQEAEKARYEEAERAEEESYARRQDERAQENADLELALDIIRNDSTALALMRIFIAVQEERLGADETLDCMHGVVHRTEERYQQRLNDAQRATESAQRQVSEAQRRARDAEDDLGQAKRKAKRGW